MKNKSNQRLNNKLLAGLTILFVFILLASAGKLIAPYAKNYIEFEAWLKPSGTHLLGTDSLYAVATRCAFASYHLFTKA